MKKFIEIEVTSGGEVGDPFEAKDMVSALQEVFERGGTKIKEVEEEKVEREEEPSCPQCGCQSFYAHQVCRVDIVVDGHNTFLENIISDKELGNSVYDSETPYGPYQCIECGKEFSELSDIGA